METLLIVKDRALFEEWFAVYEKTEGFTPVYEEAYNLYITASLSYFIFKIVIPAALAIHSYFAYVKLQINKLFIFIWSVLVLGGMAQVLVEWNYYSLFYYINLAGYFVLALTVISLTGITGTSKSL